MNRNDFFSLNNWYASKLTILKIAPNYFFFAGMETTCFMFSILELWAKDGNFTQASEEDIYALTLEDVIEKVNSNNVR